MKTEIRKLEGFEVHKFTSVTKRKDYAKVVLEIAKKILDTRAVFSKDDPVSIPYLTYSYDKKKRVHLYLDKNKYYSIGYNLNVKTCNDTGEIKIFTRSGIECTYERISHCLSIIDQINGSSLIDAYVDLSDDGDYEADDFKMLEGIWYDEPGYIRYDHDEKHANGNVHPQDHLDVNISDSSSYKLGLIRPLQPVDLEKILSEQPECRFIARRQDITGLSKHVFHPKKNIKGRKRRR